MHQLLEDFVPVANAIGRFRESQGADGQFFYDKIAPQGHFSSIPFTKQGTYIFSASGKLLASGNDFDGRSLSKVLDSAKEKYARLPEFNEDFVWFTKEDIRLFLPENPVTGAISPVPKTKTSPISPTPVRKIDR